MKRSGLFAAVVALSLAGVAGQARATLVIDSFSSGSFGLANSGTGNPTPTTVTKNQTSLSGVLGGTRNLTLTVTNNDQPDITRAFDTVNTATQRFSISNDDGVDSTSVLLYNGGGAGLGGVDFTAFGTGIAFNIVSIDLSVSITIELTDTLGATLTQTRSGLGANSVAVFNFNAFAGAGDSKLVNAVKVTFSTPQAADLSGSFLRVTGIAVPEPTTAAALASGVLAMMGGASLRRRRAPAA